MVTMQSSGEDAVACEGAAAFALSGLGGGVFRRRAGLRGLDERNDQTSLLGGQRVKTDNAGILAPTGAHAGLTGGDLRGVLLGRYQRTRSSDRPLRRRSGEW